LVGGEAAPDGIDFVSGVGKTTFDIILLNTTYSKKLSDMDCQGTSQKDGMK